MRLGIARVKLNRPLQFGLHLADSRPGRPRHPPGWREHGAQIVQLDRPARKALGV